MTKKELERKLNIRTAEDMEKELDRLFESLDEIQIIEVTDVTSAEEYDELNNFKWESYEEELKAIDKAILKTVQGLNPEEYTVLNSIPGIGKVYSAGILAEIGSIKAFQNANQLAKYCGIVWNDNDSGDFESEDSRMSKAGNRYLRYYIIEATGSVINHCPEYKAFYQKKYAETRNHQHKRALALTSRKFIRLLYGLLDKGQLYSPEKSR